MSLPGSGDRIVSRFAGVGLFQQRRNGPNLDPRPSRKERVGAGRRSGSRGRVDRRREPANQVGGRGGRKTWGRSMLRPYRILILIDRPLALPAVVVPRDIR